MSPAYRAPFVKSCGGVFSHAADLFIALIPALMWSVYIFGARVITICVISVAFTFLLDYPVRRWIVRAPRADLIDPFNAVYGILSAFMLPVSVPLWAPAVSALLTVFAKNLAYPGGRRIFNPYIFPAAVMNIAFGEMMSTFTRPLAYFNPFSFVLDEKLVAAYRVISPLQQSADGSVYENGVVPRFIGYASGHIGEVAVAATLLGAVWLFVRKRGDIKATFAFLAVIFALAYLFPSDDAETSYYAFSLLFTGAIALIAVFALNDGYSLPLTGTGRLICAIVCGVCVFLGRKFGGDTEWGYYAVLAVNALSPVLEKITRPRPFGSFGKARKR